MYLTVLISVIYTCTCTCMYPEYFSVSKCIEPSTHPSSVRISQLTSNSVTFQWDHLKCNQQNGPITGYVYHLYNDVNQCTEGFLDHGTNTLTVFDTTVQAFSVAAMNLVGIGEYSPIVHVHQSAFGNYSSICITYMYIDECRSNL